MPFIQPPALNTWIVEYINAYRDTYKRSPSIRELTKAYNEFQPTYAISTMTMHAYIGKMLKSGLLIKTADKYRNLRVNPSYGNISGAVRSAD